MFTAALDSMAWHCKQGDVRLSGIFPVLQWSRYLVEQVKRNVNFPCCGSEGLVMPMEYQPCSRELD